TSLGCFVIPTAGPSDPVILRKSAPRLRSGLTSALIFLRYCTGCVLQHLDLALLRRAVTSPSIRQPDDRNHGSIFSKRGPEKAVKRRVPARSSSSPRIVGRRVGKHRLIVCHWASSQVRHIVEVEISKPLK